MCTNGPVYFQVWPLTIHLPSGTACRILLYTIGDWKPKQRLVLGFRDVLTQCLADRLVTAIVGILGKPVQQRLLGIVIGSGVKKQLQGINMTVPSGAVQHGLSARILGINVGAVLNQPTHDLGVAVTRRVVNRLIAAAVGCCRKARMSLQQGAYPRGISKKDRRQKLARQIIYRSDMSIQGPVLYKQRNDRFIVRYLAGVMHHVTIVGGQIGASLDEEPHDLFAPVKSRVENRPPTVLIIGVDECGIDGN